MWDHSSKKPIEDDAPGALERNAFRNPSTYMLDIFDLNRRPRKKGVVLQRV